MRGWTISLAVAMILAGVHPAKAAAHAAHRASDPLETFNRANFRSSRAFQRFLGPLFKLYARLTPGVIGKGIHNVLVNLNEPVVIINYVLQARIGRAGEAGARLAFNSTLGIGGLIDVAGAAGNPHHDNSFGDTLGRYGAGPGPFLFLPLLGPTTVRDLAGTGVDMAINPLHWVSFRYRTQIDISAGIAGFFDTASRSLPEEEALLAGAADPYATLRSAYLQSREAEVREGRAPASLPDLDLAPLAPPDAGSTVPLAAPADAPSASPSAPP